LGFAYRHISLKFESKGVSKCEQNRLPARVKTIADWIRVKRDEKRIARYHIALKMGIATPLVGAWESGISRPDAQQMRVLIEMLGKYCRQTETQANVQTQCRKHCQKSTLIEI